MMLLSSSVITISPSLSERIQKRGNARFNLSSQTSGGSFSTINYFFDNST